jgi:hypothetical protein
VASWHISVTLRERELAGQAHQRLDRLPVIEPLADLISTRDQHPIGDLIAAPRAGERRTRVLQHITDDA